MMRPSQALRFVARAAFRIVPHHALVGEQHRQEIQVVPRHLAERQTGRFAESGSA